MRVWLIQRSEPTPHDDNASQRLMRTGIVAEKLAAAGHEVVWWTSTFDHYGRRQRFSENTRLDVRPNYQVQYLKGSGYRRNISFARVLENIAVSSEFAKLALNGPMPDIVVASIPTVEMAAAAARYAKKHGIPLIVDIRDLWPDVFEDVVPSHLRPVVRALSMPMRAQLRYACSSATAIVGLTHKFVAWGARAAKRPIHPKDRVVPMAYDSKQLSESAIAAARKKWRELGVQRVEGQLILVFFGTFGRGFDLDVVMNAAKNLQERQVQAKFVICGSGENWEHLKAQSDTLDNVLMPGWVNAAEIRALIELADLGLAPYVETKNFVDNITNKPAEYLSGSLPILTSLGHGQLYELLQSSGSGLSYRNSATLLADHVEALTNNNALLEEMKIFSRKLYQDMFNGNMVYGQFIAYLENIVATLKSPRGK